MACVGTLCGNYQISGRPGLRVQDLQHGFEVVNAAFDRCLLFRVCGYEVCIVVYFWQNKRVWCNVSGKSMRTGYACFIVLGAFTAGCLG